MAVKKKKRGNIKLYEILVIIVAVSVITFIGFGDYLDKITGKASTSGLTNLTITVGSMTLSDISLIAAQSVSEAATTNVTFSFIIDVDAGTSVLTDGSAHAVFNVSGYTPIREANCGRQDDINSTRANYSCSIFVWYFDPAGNWSVYANISDSSGNKAQRLEVWNLSELSAMVIAPQSLTWATIAVSAKNATSNNDPTIINNTGNSNLSSVRVNAVNLGGLGDGSKFIPVANFTVYNNTGGGNPECSTSALNGATALVNATTTAINGVGVYRGNNSASLGKQNLYYCIIDVPAQLSTQTYSTNNTGSWTISVV